MTIQIKYALFVLVLPFLGCAEVSNADRVNTEMSISNSEVNNQSNAKISNQEAKNNLYVFVGEKISVEEFNPETKKGEIPFDQAFNAKYKVIQNLYGNYENDTIEFEVYDHYGFPPFAKYKTVLLFVSEHKGKLCHEKYQ